MIVEFCGGPMDGEVRAVQEGRRQPPVPVLHWAPGGDVRVSGHYVKREKPPRFGDPWSFDWKPNE